MKSPSPWPFVSIFLWLAGMVIGGAEKAPDEQPLVETISAALILEAAKVGCTNTEIADRFMTTEAKVVELFEMELVIGRALRAFSLRKAQTIAAYKGNGPLLTWLGRNELNQSLNPSASGEPEPSFEAKVG